MKVAQFFVVLASFSMSCKAATVADIASGVTDAIDQAKSLEQTYNNLNNYNWMFSGPNLHTGISNIASQMEKVASDITALSDFPLPESTSAAFFTSAAPLLTLTEQFVQSLISRKAELAKIPVVGPFSGAVIRSELQTLQGGLNTLTAVMMKATAPSLVNNATDLKALLDNAMASALNAYA